MSNELECLKSTTRELVELHPLSVEEIEDVVLSVWDEIASISIRGLGLLEISNPQVTGTLIQRLIGEELAERYPGTWRGEQEKNDKDLVFIPEPSFSIEVKTSTHAREVFGNRSYTHGNGRKSKQGYFLAINYSSVGIRRIRFGWLLSEEWKSQKSASGQQARLLAETYEESFVRIYESI